MKLLPAIALGAMACLAMPLAGCTTLNQITSAYTAITDASVPPQVVTVSANGFDAVKSVVTSYIAYCTPNPQPIGCSDTAIRKAIPAVRSGTAARDALEAFQAAHPGALGSKGLYDALVAATGTLKTIVTQYNLGATK